MSTIRIHTVEQGRGSVGCHPLGVQIQAIASELADLARLLQEKGYQTQEGKTGDGGTLQYLCVRKDNEQLMRADVIRLLKADTYLDLSLVTE